MDVKKTLIYRTLAPCIRKQDRRQFAEELQKAADSTSSFLPSRTNLMAAFVWAETPQGHAFWNVLHRRLHEAGHYAEIKGAP